MATAYELGWSTVTNGDLIRLAEQEGYELLLTTDTNLRYQQNLRSRSIAILVLTTPGQRLWPLGLKTPIEEWPYLDESTLLKTRSRKVCMTCHCSGITPG